MTHKMSGFRFTVFIAVYILMGLNACDSGSRAGKPTGAETTNSIAVLVIDTLGVPVSNAMILVHGKQMWYETFIGDQAIGADTLFTNAQGKVVVSRDSVPTIFTVIAQNQSAVVEFSSELDTLEIQMSKSMQVSGKIMQSLWNSNIKIHIIGTPWTSSIDSLGNYHFSNLPPGQWILMVHDSLQSTSTWIASVTGESDAFIEIDSTQIHWNALAIDHFNQASRRMLLGTLTGQGWWYLWKDEGITLVNPLQDANGVIRVEDGISPLNAYEGQSLEIRYTITGISRNNLHLGVRLSNEPWNGSNLQSIDMMVRGDASGTIRLVDTTGATLSHSFALTDTAWTPLQITLSEMTYNGTDPAGTRESLMQSLYEFRLEINAGTWIGLDQIWFTGMSLDDLLLP